MPTIDSIPIFTFHSIDSSGSIISIAPSRFRQLLRTLKQKGYQTISLDEITQWLSGKTTFNSPTCAITFDDGFEGVYHHGFPLLSKYGYEATVFLTTGYCGKNNDWLTQASDIPVLPMLRWEQIEEMSRFEFDFQAHTQSHPLLPSLNPEQFKRELLGSKTEIEDRLGKRVHFFAYPYRFFNEGEDVLVREIFQGACTTRLSFVLSQSSRYLLPRIDSYYFSHQTTSKLFLSPLFRPYLKLRYYLSLVRQSMKNNH